MQSLCYECQCSFILKFDLITITDIFAIGLALKERLRECRKWSFIRKARLAKVFLLELRLFLISAKSIKMTSQLVKKAIQVMTTQVRE